MARFAEALLPAINAVDPEGVEEAKTIVDGIPDRFRSAWLARMRGKLGIAGAFDGEGDLIDGLFEALERHGVDFTCFFRAVAALLRGEARKSVVSGKSVSVRVDLGGRRIIKKKKS